MSFFSLLDHPIHPPKSNNDPWDCEFLPDLDEYVIKPVKGVFQVYRNTADAEANRMAEGYEYPDLESYVTDMHLMCALIAGEYSSFIIVLYKFLSNFYTWPSSKRSCEIKLLELNFAKIFYYFSTSRWAFEIVLLSTSVLFVIKVSVARSIERIARIGCSESCRSSGLLQCPKGKIHRDYFF